MDPSQMLGQMMQQGPQAQQQAGPSAAQPGGGGQSIQGLTPQQQELLANFNMFLAQGDRLCTQLKSMNEAKDAADLDIMLAKITKSILLRLTDEFKEDALEAQLAGGANAQQQAQTGNMM